MENKCLFRDAESNDVLGIRLCMPRGCADARSAGAPETGMFNEKGDMPFALPEDVGAPALLASAQPRDMHSLIFKTLECDSLHLLQRQFV